MTPEEYKALRQAIGRQKEIAATLGISRYTLAHRESGRIPLTVEATLAILHLYDITRRPLTLPEQAKL